MTEANDYLVQLSKGIDGVATATHPKMTQLESEIALQSRSVAAIAAAVADFYETLHDREISPDACNHMTVMMLHHILNGAHPSQQDGDSDPETAGVREGG